jgi:UDP-galactopyranose mutase
MPFNMNTFHELWGVTTAEEAKAKIAEEVAKEKASKSPITSRSRPSLWSAARSTRS